MKKRLTAFLLDLSFQHHDEQVGEEPNQGEHLGLVKVKVQVDDIFNLALG